MESRFCHLTKLRCACVLPLWSPQFGCALHWSGERDSPPLMTGGFVIDDRGYIGGRGIARPPSSSQLPRVLLRRRCVLRWKDCTSGLPPHNVGKFLRGADVTEMGRSGDTMICEKATFCTRVQVGTARMRYHATGVWSSRAMLGLGCRRLGRFDDTIRRVGMGLLHRWDAPVIPRSVSGWLTTFPRVQVVPLGTLRRYHGLCDWKAPDKSERSGRNAIPCSGWARSFTGSTCGFADDRNASTIPSSGSVFVCGQ